MLLKSIDGRYFEIDDARAAGFAISRTRAAELIKETMRGDDTRPYWWGWANWTWSNAGGQPHWYYRVI